MPYIGYWQLMNAVDEYVIYDDVNFIKGGWINRNRILVNGEPKYFNIPMLGASSNKLINEIGVNNDLKLIKKNIRQLESAYKKAPYFNEIMPMMDSILRCGKENLAEYIQVSFRTICSYLNITTKLIVSSELKKNNNLRAQDKVLAICKLLKADEYYNAIGGQEIYSFRDFKENNIKLSFLKTKSIEYKQFENNFQPNLSIIDMMMFCSVEEIQEKLNQYSLICDDEF